MPLYIADCLAIIEEINYSRQCLNWMLTSALLNNIGSLRLKRLGDALDLKLIASVPFFELHSLQSTWEFSTVASPP